MNNDSGIKKGTNIFSEEREVSILKHFTSPKSPRSNSNTAFLYSDPPEVILQSKKLYHK